MHIRRSFLPLLLGIACDDVNCSIVQQFESNYVKFDRVPNIKNGWLEFSGGTSRGITFKSAQLWYDALPKPLQAAQIRRTYCYDSGTPILFIREPAPPGSFYQGDNLEYSWPNCSSPRDEDGSARPNKITSFLPDHSGQVPWEDATVYRERGDRSGLRALGRGLLQDGG